MGVFSNSTFGGSGNLSTISGYLKNPNASEESKIWNYGRYAYITLIYNGVNNAGIQPCSTNIKKIGDTALFGPSGSTDYQSLITRDGDRHIPARPILESVRIGNDGSTDVSDAALYDVDVSFKVFSKPQFEEIEKAWFVPGNEFTISFGYKDLPGFDGSINANVYNFSFTMDAVGVYSCNIQLTGRNRFAAILSMKNEMAQAGTELTDEAGETYKALSILGELYNRFESQFPQFEESSFIQRSSTADFVEDGKATLSPNGLYAVANIQTKGGFDFNVVGLTIDTDDKFVKYVKYEELVNVINYANSDSGYKWEFGTENAKFIPQMASADPSAILLDGEMANYGGEGDTFNDLATGAGTTGAAKDILISLELIGSTLKALEEKEETDKDEKGSTSVNSFLSTLNRKIEDLTGGLYPLVIYNSGFETDAVEFKIVHKYAEHTATKAAYTFSMHDIGSVLKSVNLSSNMDSDMAAAALVSNRGGEIPDGALDNLYKDCGGTKSTPPDSKVTLDDIAKKKQVLGSGFSPERVADLRDAQISYVKSNTTTTGTDTGYRYMIDLSVTHLGAWGTQIADTFSFDGLPKKFRKDHVYFAVGKVEHQFDGQGGWDTTVTGFCKIDDVPVP